MALNPVSGISESDQIKLPKLMFNLKTNKKWQPFPNQKTKYSVESRGHIESKKMGDRGREKGEGRNEVKVNIE